MDRDNEIDLGVDLRAIVDAGLDEEFNALIRVLGGMAFFSKEYLLLLEIAHNHKATVTADAMLPYVLWGPN